LTERQINIDRAPKYKLTSRYVLYFKGEAYILNIGDVFTLAGLKLSSYGNKSPFHYNCDIIRLPNSILQKVD